MTIYLPLDLEAAIRVEATRLGTTPQSLVEETLRKSVARSADATAEIKPSLEPIDDWERRLLAIARPCGVSLSNEALSSEALYD